jgi:hypothetical protein
MRQRDEGDRSELCVEIMIVGRELTLHTFDSARARGPYRCRASVGAESGAWRNSPNPSSGDGGRVEEGQTTEGHPHDGTIL